MPTCKHLVLLETSGNQEYLFATNRLQENVGASELTYQAGTKFVLEAIGDPDIGGGPDLTDYNNTPGRLRQLLSKHTARNGIEVIIATSGKALFLTSDFEVGRQIIAAATRRALRDAPGLDLFGMISEGFDWETESVHDCLETLYQRFESLRGSRPQPSARFPMLPVCEPCASSGLPAWDLDTEGDPVSRQSWQKRQAAEGWRKRIIKILKPKKHWVGKRLDHLEQLGELDEDFTGLDWTAVVHADGNGFGRIFRELPHYLNGAAGSAGFNEHYVSALRRLSLALEEATEEAFCEALKVLPKITKRVRVKPRTEDKPRWDKHEILPIVPLVLGGDDLTVVCEGRHALAFTWTFLEAFEKQTERTDLFGGIAPEIAKKTGGNHLSACAGVAITKPHFPFYSGYTLAEQLLRSAKTIKQKIQHCSAMDFHVLYDASFTGLDAIRRRLLQDNETTALTAKPYVVTDPAKLEAVGPDDWVANHHVQNLWERVQVINARDEEGRRKLPNSQLHALREALSMGHVQADARLRLICHHYPDLDNLLDNSVGGSLFRETGESDSGKPCRETGFLDALDSAAFWEKGRHDDAANTDE